MRWGTLAVWPWALVVAAGGCAGGGGGGPDVGRFEPRGDLPDQAAILSSGDGSLAALAGSEDGGERSVTFSHDGGRTWRAVVLPDQPVELVVDDFEGPLDGDLIAVAGHDPTSASPVLPVARSQFIVWTTTDGDAWNRVLLDTSGPLVGEPAVAMVGPVLVASTSTSVGFDVFTSADRGASWQQARVTGLEHVPFQALAVEHADATGEQLRLVVHPTTWSDRRRQELTSADGGRSWSAAPCPQDCAPPPVRGTPVVKDGQVTTDGGVTWHDIVVEPPPEGDDGPYLSTRVEVEDGWLAAASSSEVGDIEHGMLLRSSDGRSWRQVLAPEPCPASRPNTAVGDPVRFRGRWYVTYGCADLGFAVFAVVYQGGDDARSFEPVDGTERDGVNFGPPLTAGDHLLLPEYDADGALVGFTTIG